MVGGISLIYRCAGKGVRDLIKFNTILPIRHMILDDLRPALGCVLPTDAFDEVAVRIWL